MDDGDTAWLFSRKALGEGYEAFLRGLCAGNIRKVTHDVKETMRFLLGQDLPIEGFCFDTALAGYLLDATQGSYTVDRMFVQYCGSQIGLADEKELGEAAVTANLFARTAAVAALYAVLPAKLEAQGMQELYYDMELPLCAVLARMETAGVLVDPAGAGRVRQYALGAGRGLPGHHLWLCRRGIQHQLAEAARGAAV